jgi:hypothetical protein
MENADTNNIDTELEELYQHVTSIEGLKVFFAQTSDLNNLYTPNIESVVQRTPNYIEPPEDTRKRKLGSLLESIPYHCNVCIESSYSQLT